MPGRTFICTQGRDAASDGSAGFGVRFASGEHFFNFIVAVSLS
jgi:hypothetical protein